MITIINITDERLTNSAPTADVVSNNDSFRRRRAAY